MKGLPNARIFSWVHYSWKALPCVTEVIVLIWQEKEDSQERQKLPAGRFTASVWWMTLLCLLTEQNEA